MNGGLLSSNNNPLLLLQRSYFTPSVNGTGRCSLRSFTAMLLMSVSGVCVAGLGIPNE